MTRRHVTKFRLVSKLLCGKSSNQAIYNIIRPGEMLELHAWGPAFGLPSIEPECVATIAYCQRVIPKGQWALVAGFDTTVGVTGTLKCPALSA
jgi:hypothetical protein